MLLVNTHVVLWWTLISGDEDMRLYEAEVVR